MLVQMSKIQIIGTRDQLEQAIRTLHRAGVVQIEEKLASVEPLVQDDKALRQRDETAQLLARLEALVAIMPKRALPRDAASQYENETARPTAQVLADVKAALAKLDAPVQDLAKRREQLEADRVTLPRYAKTMKQLMPLAAELAPLKNYDTVALLIDKKSAAVIDLLREQVAGIAGDQYELVSRELDKETTGALIVYPREHAAAIQNLLGRESITQVRLPEELSDVSFRDALARIETRLAAIPGEVNKTDRELAVLADEWRMRLSIWVAVLRDRLQELEVRAKFGATQYTFVVNGWVPRKALPALQQALDREVGDQIVLEELPLTHEELEKGPVVLSNPGPAKPFEFLVRLMALPRYNTIDPTPLMAIFLPIFFGLILGDVGYGLVVLLGALYLYRRTKPGGIHALSMVIVYCAVWSIVFGFVFGEFFGALGEEWFHMHPYFPRGESEFVTTLFGFTIALGVVQIGLGFALGIYQALKLHQRHELLDRVAKVIALIGIFALVGSMSSALPAGLMTPGLALLVIGVVLLIYTLGGMGVILAPIEIIGVLGNILSYLRLAAIGLSSVYLAMVANKMAEVIGGGGGIGIIFGIIVGALFHALNIALGILSPTIQSLRLHYVEFFSKFFEGGGADYTPFKRQDIQ